MKKIKKFIAIVTLVTSILIVFTGCGNMKATSSGQLSKANERKGSRENPYHVGEKIVLSNVYDYRLPDTEINVEFEVEKAFSILEGENIMQSQGYDSYTFIPCVEVNLKLESDYSDPIEWYAELFSLSTVTEDLEIGGCNVDDGSLNPVWEFFTGKEYTVYFTRNVDNKRENNPKILYVMIEYNSDASTKNKIYVQLDEEVENDNLEEASSSNAIDSTDVIEESEEEKKYSLAEDAKEKGYYTVAKQLYEEVIDYKDARQKYNEMMDILKPYNGTYYGESTDRKGVFYNIFIKDGDVRVQLKDSNSNISRYELYKYGEDKNTGAPILAFGYIVSKKFYDRDFNEGYAIQKLPDGTYLVARTEGNTYSTFNGFYDKVSDIVEDESMFVETR